MSAGRVDESEDESVSSTVCFLCRQRKTKCDRKLPRCGFCVKAKIDCRYVSKPKQPGLRAGYVSELESRIAALEREVGELKDREPNAAITSTPRALSHPAMEDPSPRQIHAGQPSPVTPRPVARSHGFDESNAAVRDLMTLPHEYFATLTDLWFKHNQPWVPILNQQQIQESLEALPDPVAYVEDIVLRAVISLEVAYSSQAICLGYHGRRRLSQYLRSQVVVEAMGQPSFDSLRALLIIALLDYGSDEVPSTFSLLAMCRRMSENIGLFRQLLVRIERESPAQVGPPSRETFESAEVAIPLTWCILALDAVSSLGISWRDVSAALVDHLSSIAYLSTPDFRDSFRTHTHLAAIGLQPVHEFFHAYSKGRYQDFDSATMATCEDMFQNLMSYVQGLPTNSYTLLADGGVDFDICHIFTRVLAHAAVIMIYQKFLFEAAESTNDLACQRCLASYNEIIAAVRNISDADVEINSPVFASMLCVAARFRIALDRHLSRQRDPLFDILMHALNMCGRRWPLARRLDIVLRAAIVQVDTGESSSLPEDFWNLKISGHDMAETVKRWVHDYKPSLYIGSLNGPYA